MVSKCVQMCPDSNECAISESEIRTGNLATLRSGPCERNGNKPELVQLFHFLPEMTCFTGYRASMQSVNVSKHVKACQSMSKHVKACQSGMSSIGTSKHFQSFASDTSGHTSGHCRLGFQHARSYSLPPKWPRQCGKKLGHPVEST